MWLRVAVHLRESCVVVVVVVVFLVLVVVDVRDWCAEASRRRCWSGFGATVVVVVVVVV